MMISYDSLTNHKIAPALCSAKMFLLKDPLFSHSLLFDKGWSSKVQRLVTAKAPVCNIPHAAFFEYRENVHALSDHLKNESQNLS